MATKNNVTPEELVEILKFTPRTYRVSIYGYGGEVAMGRIKSETYDYFKEKGIRVDEYATSWSSARDEDYIDIPEDLRPFEQGSWYDCDNLEHESGASFDSATIQVDDENNDTVWERGLGTHLEDEGCQVECFSETDPEDFAAGTCMFFGASGEKGTFFEAELELKEPFDPKKFKFAYCNINGWNILSSVAYDGEYLDGADALSTTGKSADFMFIKVLENGELETYEYPEDEPSPLPAFYSYYGNDSERVSFKFTKKTRPHYKGWYDCIWGNTTSGALYWDGDKWLAVNDFNKVYEIKSVNKWTGFNWDTSDWSNCPQKDTNE